jgi:hypothetical protein
VSPSSVASPVRWLVAAIFLAVSAFGLLLLTGVAPFAGPMVLSDCNPSYAAAVRGGVWLVGSFGPLLSVFEASRGWARRCRISLERSACDGVLSVVAPALDELVEVTAGSARRFACIRVAAWPTSKHPTVCVAAPASTAWPGC